MESEQARDNNRAPEKLTKVSGLKCSLKYLVPHPDQSRGPLTPTCGKKRIRELVEREYHFQCWLENWIL